MTIFHTKSFKCISAHIKLHDLKNTCRITKIQFIKIAFIKDEFFYYLSFF